MPRPEIPNKVIYSMVGVSKFYDKKQVLKDIYLAYFYGAKIGVIGRNGSGKSSLRRILAGETVTRANQAHDSGDDRAQERQQNDGFVHTS